MGARQAAKAAGVAHSASAGGGARRTATQRRWRTGGWSAASERRSPIIHTGSPSRTGAWRASSLRVRAASSTAAVRVLEARCAGAVQPK
eukprot:3137307-Pleurochrysis_carterae.AAC.1